MAEFEIKRKLTEEEVAKIIIEKWGLNNISDILAMSNENKKDIKQVHLPKTCKIEYTRPMIKFKVDGTPYPSGTTIKIIYKDIKKEITIVPISGRVLIKEGKYEV